MYPCRLIMTRLLVLTSHALKRMCFRNAGMALNAEFVSALINNAAARTRPDYSFRSLAEARSLALCMLKVQIMEKIVLEMVKSRMSGYVKLDTGHDEDCWGWLQHMGFDIYSTGDEEFVTWGRFPRLAQWQKVPGR